MCTGWKIVFYYWAAVSLVAILLTVHDKRAARRGAWRVRERTLLLWALAGGSLAMWIAMLAIRHKTRRPKFMVGLPCILALQIILVAAACMHISAFSMETDWLF